MNNSKSTLTPLIVCPLSFPPPYLRDQPLNLNDQSSNLNDQRDPHDQRVLSNTLSIPEGDEVKSYMEDKGYERKGMSDPMTRLPLPFPGFRITTHAVLALAT